MKIKKIIPILLLITIAGCGGKPNVKGKVVFSDDKTPVKQGIVIFENEKGIARGQIDENGTYTIGSEKATDGLQAGTYKVYLAGTEIFDSSGGFPKMEYVVDRKYDKPETSGLTVEVKKSRTYDLEIDRYKKK